MAVTGTSVAAATMLAAAAAIFITFVICFYLFLCAKRYRGAAPTIGGIGGGGGGGSERHDRGRPRFVFAGAGCHGGGGGMDEAAIAALPRKEVGAGDPPADCAVCIAEVGPGEAARVLPRCGHAFHVECVDMWLRSHSTCPLCRCAVAEDDGKPVPARAPEADPESPNFPTNVLFFGSQDAVSTRGAAAPAPAAPPPVTLPQAPQVTVAGPIAGVAAVVEAARVAALRRLLGCGGGATPSPTPAQQQQQQNQDCDLESGLGGGETSGSPRRSRSRRLLESWFRFLFSSLSHLI